MTISTYEEVIEFFGGVPELAAALGCSRQAVHQWGGKIPRARAFEIEIISKRKIKAKDLLSELADAG